LYTDGGLVALSAALTPATTVRAIPVVFIFARMTVYGSAPE
jgi:hypothetical protein